MDPALTNSIGTIVFFVAIGIFAITSILTAYILVRYGQTKTLTVTICLVFAALFLLQTLVAFIALQKIF